MLSFGYAHRSTGGGGAVTPPVITVPKVVTSKIPADGSGIMVVFDQAMHMTSKLQDALSVIVDGGTPVHPDHVDIIPDKTAIGIKFPVGFFKTGQVVTWAYNDQHATEELKGAIAGGLEVDNQTYAVVNETITRPKVVSSQIYANNSKRILVEWDQEMEGTPDLRFGISIVIDGGTPIIPNAVTFNAKFMTLSDNFKADQDIKWTYDNTLKDSKLTSKVGKVEAAGAAYSVVNKLVATANYASAEVPASSGGWHVDVTLSDDTGHDSVSSEWELKVDGKVRTDIFVTGKNTTVFQLRFVAGTTQDKLIKGGEVVTVSHKVADSGVLKFIDQPVTNNLAVTPPPPPPDDDDDMLDLDGDGKPDRLIQRFGKVVLSEDDDSYNVDFNGDGIADLVIPK